MLKTFTLTAASILILTACGPAMTAMAAPAPETEQTVNASRLNSSLCTRARANQISNIQQISRDGKVNIDGWDVNFNTKNWKAEHPSNNKTTMNFYSNNWLTPSDVKDVPYAVELVLQQAKANPDRGSKLMKNGWSEAAVTKRLQSVSCLYSISRDKRLIPVINELAAANMDESRYYGPPLRGPHNHGVMADRALIDASRVVNRPEWEKKAIQRLQLQLPGTFDRCGMMFEQASTYQNFHSTLWRQVANRARGMAFAEDVITASLNARSMVETLANPDGTYEIIGDGKPITVDVSGPVRGSAKWCPETGWAANTTVDGNLVQHNVMRFGPGTTFHGHPDKGAMTWWVGDADRVGKRVLTDRGLYGKNRDWRLDYARSSEAHSTLLWDGGTNLKTAGKQSSDSSSRVTKFSAQNKKGSWNRTITTSSSQPRVRFEDVVRGPAAKKGATQMFALAPEWKETKSTGVYRTSDGWRLTVKCSASSGRVKVDDKRVEHYPEYGVIESATTVHCTAPGAGNRIVLSATLQIKKP